MTSENRSSRDFDESDTVPRHLPRPSLNGIVNDLPGRCEPSELNMVGGLCVVRSIQVTDDSFGAFGTASGVEVEDYSVSHLDDRSFSCFGSGLERGRNRFWESESWRIRCGRKLKVDVSFVRGGRWCSLFSTRLRLHSRKPAGSSNDRMSG